MFCMYYLKLLSYLKVNSKNITHEKPSTVKKMMKPHKNILRLTIERSSRKDRTFMGQLRQDPSWSSTLNTSYSTSTNEDKHYSWSESGTPLHTGKQLESDYTQQSLVCRLTPPFPSLFPTLTCAPSLPPSSSLPPPTNPPPSLPPSP